MLVFIRIINPNAVYQIYWGVGWLQDDTGRTQLIL